METTELPPRVKHNADLCTQFIAEQQITHRFRKVSEQVECLGLEQEKLVRFGYNPSICPYQNGLLMAYRYHEGNTFSTRIAAAQLDYDGRVLSNRTLAIPCDGQSVEDPKLYIRGGETWICWVQSTWPNQPLSAVVRYGRIQDDGTVTDIRQPAPPTPKPIEKNWCPMEGHTFIYESEPEQLVIDFATNTVLRAQAPHWAYGAIRGGTPPIPYQGKLLRFFHSGLDNEFDGWRRRYFLGAALHEASAPFAVVQVSTHPVAFGSELDDLPVKQRADCVQYKPRVVFPGGAVEHNGAFLVAVGINDSACAILRVTPQQLHFPKL